MYSYSSIGFPIGVSGMMRGSIAYSGMVCGGEGSVMVIGTYPR
jgi:hypothetical protein